VNIRLKIQRLLGGEEVDTQFVNVYFRERFVEQGAAIVGGVADEAATGAEVLAAGAHAERPFPVTFGENIKHLLQTATRHAARSVREFSGGGPPAPQTDRATAMPLTCP